ncbi:MAG: O-antigen ligase family protein [Clostridia bacterium]|jgi:O-antigen ligase|nr:O-antigen ligase family protein [Clostridia bacterium]MDH7572250.1 O-antigen ligase family protein [Clostridia bacterium]
MINILLGAAASCFLLLSGARRGLKVLSKDVPYALPYLLFLGWYAVTLCWSPDPSGGLRTVVRLITPFALSLVAACTLFQGQGVRRAYLAVLVAVLIPLGVGYWQALGGAVLEKGLRLNSVFYHSSNYALFLYFVLVTIVFGRPFSRGSVHPAVHLALIGSIIAHLILAGSRVTWLACAAAGIVWASERHEARWRFPVLVLGGLTLAFVVLRVIPEDLLARRFAELAIGDLAQALERTDVPMGWRMVVWRALVDRWRMSPFIGWGAGSVDQYVNEVVGVEYVPHSEYVRILFEAGLVGILLFGVTMFFIFKDAVRMARYGNHALLAITVGFAIILLTDNLLYYYNVSLYFWTAVALFSTGRGRPVGRRGAGADRQVADGSGPGVRLVVPPSPRLLVGHRKPPPADSATWGAGARPQSISGTARWALGE